jgi:hypothetical protein
MSLRAPNFVSPNWQAVDSLGACVDDSSACCRVGQADDFPLAEADADPKVHRKGPVALRGTDTHGAEFSG